MGRDSLAEKAEGSMTIEDIIGPAHQLDHPDGPQCRCGKPSKHQSGWCGGCSPPSFFTRPKLPYCVHDDAGKAWSSHLAGERHALEHYNLALEHGIQNPMITDNGGNDITQWVTKDKENDTK